MTRIDSQKTIFEIPISEIRLFDFTFSRYNKDDLTGLCASIRKNGILEPLDVCVTPHGYKVISGTRRLTAAQICGFETVPCRIRKMTEEEAALTSLQKEIHAQRPHYFDVAARYQHTLQTTQMSVEELSEETGIDTKEILQKLALLSLPLRVRDELVAYRFRERQARALLKLHDEDTMLHAIRYAFKEKMNVARFEEYIKELSNRQNGPKFICRDLRLYMNTIGHTVRMMEQSGFRTVCEKDENENAVAYRILIHKS